jgi:hypothetical protein
LSRIVNLFAADFRDSSVFNLRMAAFELSRLSTPDLLKIHAQVLAELRNRQVVRSENAPTGDYAEWLCVQRLGLVLQKNSALGFDAIDSIGTKFQIKGRRVTPANKSVQLGAIRDLDRSDFDFLVGILFDQNYSVTLALKIPHAVVCERARFVSRTNSNTLHLRMSLLEDKRVENLTAKFSSITSA